MSVRHEPVLLRETLDFLLDGPGLYLDATLGDGGHAHALLTSEPGGRLFGGDRDPDAIAASRERLAPFGDRVTLQHTTFRGLAAAHREAGGEPFAGALFDLGLSSRQIDEPGRGISYANDGPLDQRMDPTSGVPLRERLAHADEQEVADVLRAHGDVRDARRLARAIVAEARAGRLGATRDLAALVGRVRHDTRPATLAPVFQALRIWTNDEMADLEAALAWLPGVVRDGATVVTLAYHSGEDRRIKHALRGKPGGLNVRRRPAQQEVPAVWEERTRRVVVASEEEQSSNPRARSARLRAFRRKPR